MSSQPTGRVAVAYNEASPFVIEDVAIREWILEKLSGVATWMRNRQVARLLTLIRGRGQGDRPEGGD